MSMPQQIPEQAIVGELKKQYNVESLDVTEPRSISTNSRKATCCWWFSLLA